MLRPWRLLALVLVMSAVRGDYSCVCNYDARNAVHSQPDQQSSILKYLHEFDCKPVYELYTGNSYIAVQISGVLGYVNLQSNIQQHVCSGDVSSVDRVRTTTTQLTQIPTTMTASQSLTTVPTTHTPTTVPLTTTLRTVFTAQKSTTVLTTQKPTTVYTTQKSTTVLKTQKSTTVPSTQKLTTVPATQKLTTVLTTQKPKTVPTTQKSTTVQTTQKPTTVPTTQRPTTVPTTQKLTTVPQTPITVPTTPTSTANVTNSILKYIGIAYNLTNGNPIRGSETSLDMTDPGLLPGNRVFQINEYSNGTLREIETSSFPNNCTTKHALIHNGKSYQEEMMIWNRVTADHTAHLLDNAFVFNAEFNKVRAFTEAPQNTNMYQDVLTVCFQQKLRLKDALADTEPLFISRDFAKDACDLPEMYDVNEYLDFLDKWGTSIVVEAELGTKELKRYQTTEPDIFKLVNQKTPSVLHHSGAFMGYGSSLTLSRTDYANNVAQPSNLTHSGMASYRSNIGELMPVGLRLVPITFAFDWKYWGNLDRGGEFTTCVFPGFLTHVPHTTFFPYSDLKMPVTWPKGTYGLMKAANGCPGSHVTWHEGWRVQDSVFHTGIHHHFSPSLGNTLAGTFSNIIQTRYCMKTDSVTSVYDTDWPKGNYCILKRGNCPTGFSSGSIYWDDANVFNRKAHGGSLPDGSYRKDTKIYYCCRSDDAPSTSITLPIDRPFVLLRYRGTCQHVYGMSMREVYIEWDTSDVNNQDEDAGSHPFDDGGKELRLHFCFYYFNAGGIIG